MPYYWPQLEKPSSAFLRQGPWSFDFAGGPAFPSFEGPIVICETDFAAILGLAVSSIQLLPWPYFPQSSYLPYPFPKLASSDLFSIRPQHNYHRIFAVFWLLGGVSHSISAILAPRYCRARGPYAPNYRQYSDRAFLECPWDVP